jgi:hypothetical protein
MARAVLLGAVVGLATRMVHHAPELAFVHKLGAPWLAAAFAAGALARRPGWGAAQGVSALVVAVLVYYAIPEVASHPYPASRASVAWIWVAIPTGALFGAAGAIWRADGRWAPAAVTLLVAAFFGEAAIWFGRAHSPAFTLEVAAAGALLALLLRRNSERLAVAAAAGVLAVLAAATEVAVYLSLGYLVG